MFERIIKNLIKNKVSISFAESCTGGALVSTFTKVPGVSEIFEGSFVTYSNEFKEKYLNIPKEVIDEKGVVSGDVAYLMVEGLYNITKARLCISTTGNAGPTRGDLSKDVGLIYVGIMFDGYTNIYELELYGSRKENIKEITKFIYNKIEELVL